jgi:O-antigen/teichoic acid export membrane protein
MVFVKDRLILNAGYLLGISTIGALAGFFFWMLAALFYRTEDVGLASSIISVTQLLAGMAGLGLGIGLIRFLGESEKRVRMINATLSLIFITSLFIGIVYLRGIRIWSPTLEVLSGNTFYGIGFIGLLVVTVLGMLMQSTYLALRRAEFGFWQVLIMNLLRLALVISLIKFGATGIVSALAIAVLVADIVGIMVFFPRLVKGFHPRPQWALDVVRKLVPYSTANYMADLLYRAPLERLGATSSAHTYIGWMIGSLLVSPGLALAQSAFAEGSKAPDNLRPTMLRAGLYATGITIPIALLAAVIAPLLLTIFGQSYADEGTVLLRWLAAASPVSVFLCLYFSALRVRKRLKELILLSIFISVTTLSVPLLAIEDLGISSMGASWFASHVIAALIAGRNLLKIKNSRGSEIRIAGKN